MLTVTTGNLFDGQPQVLVNPVNCKGTMGAGLALKFAKIYPENEWAYRTACLMGEIRPGRPHLFHDASNRQYIVNFPTKDHWRDPSQLEWITAGLVRLKAIIEVFEFETVHIPALGCGLGGLQWDDVHREVLLALSDSPARVTLFQPIT